MFYSQTVCFSFREPFAPVNSGSLAWARGEQVPRSMPRTSRDLTCPRVSLLSSSDHSCTCSALPVENSHGVILDLSTFCDVGNRAQFRDLCIFFSQGEDGKFHLLAGAEPGAPALFTFFIVISGDFGCRDLDG